MPNLRRRVLAPAQNTGGAVPYVEGLAYVDGGVDFVEGEILTPDASDPGNFEGYTTTPLTNAATDVVVGVALQDKDSAPGFEVGHESQVIAKTGLVRKVSAAIPNRNSLFSCGITNDGSVTDYQVLVGFVYNLVRNTINGTAGWEVDANTDGTEPAAGAFRVEKVIETTGPNSEQIAVGTFVDAVLANPPA